jgi:hypothetical protein
MKQKVNFRDPKTKKLRIGCLDLKTNLVKTSDDKEYKLEKLEKLDDVGYFETCSNGKVIQKVGKFLGLI